MNLGDLSDEELYRAAGVDNLARQQKRGAGVDKFADPANLADDELFAVAGIKPGAAPKAASMREYDMVGGKAIPRPVRAPGQLPPDAITSEELYALGSSPESLKAHLNAQAATEHRSAPGFFEGVKQNWQRAVTNPKEEALRELGLLGSAVTKGVNAATLGAYGAARNLVGGAVAPEANAAANATEQQFDREHPFASGLAAGAGYLAPVGPASMVGQIAGKAGEGAARLVPRLLERPVAGAVTGAVGAGSMGAAETLADGGTLRDAGESALRGAKYGGIAGGAIGTIQGGIGRLAEGADSRISERNISDFTEGASAARRDRVVGKGGAKYDRIDSLARRTPELEQAAGDPLKQAPIVQAQIDRTGAQLDSIYDGVRVPHNVVSDPLREVAAEIRSRPHTSQQAAVADALDMEARHVSSTWRNYAQDGGVDARDARQMITSYGKGLFRGNPNSPVSIPAEIKRDVYARQTQNLGRMTEYMKPGVSEELAAANAEMSDWLNINDAVTARASRAATPGMTLKGQAHNILDTALGVMHPGHFLLKKGVEHFGPGAIRGIDRELSTGGAVLQNANPLIRALENEREQSRRRAQMLRREQLDKQQFEEEERQRRAQEAFQQQN